MEHEQKERALDEVTGGQQDAWPAEPTRPAPPVRTPGKRPAAPPSNTPESPQVELLSAVRRLETLVKEMHGHVESITRQQRHREFSAARLIGALLQAVVIGFTIAAIADWVYAAAPATLIIKLLFAGVVQLGALTAFVLSRDS